MGGAIYIRNNAKLHIHDTVFRSNAVVNDEGWGGCHLLE
jgi:hypothetical protein